MPSGTRTSQQKRHLPAGRQLAEGEDRCGQHEADVAPRPHSLVEQQNEFFAHLGMRFLAPEVEQLVLRVAAQEFDALNSELADQDLLRLAPRRHVGVAAHR